MFKIKVFLPIPFCETTIYSKYVPRVGDEIFVETDKGTCGGIVKRVQWYFGKKKKDITIYVE